MRVLNSICYENIFIRVDEMFQRVENYRSVDEEDMESLKKYVSTYLKLLVIHLQKITCSEVVEMVNEFKIIVLCILKF